MCVFRPRAARPKKSPLGHRTCWARLSEPPIASSSPTKPRGLRAKANSLRHSPPSVQDLCIDRSPKLVPQNSLSNISSARWRSLPSQLPVSGIRRHNGQPSKASEAVLSGSLPSGRKTSATSHHCLERTKPSKTRGFLVPREAARSEWTCFQTSFAEEYELSKALPLCC